MDRDITAANKCLNSVKYAALTLIPPIYHPLSRGQSELDLSSFHRFGGSVCILYINSCFFYLFVCIVCLFAESASRYTTSWGGLTPAQFPDKIWNVGIARPPELTSVNFSSVRFHQNVKPLLGLIGERCTYQSGKKAIHWLNKLSFLHHLNQRWWSTENWFLC